MTLSMESEQKAKEELAHNLSLVYELLMRVRDEKNSNSLYVLFACLQKPILKFEIPDDLESHLYSKDIDQKYIDAISTLATKFGNLNPVREALNTVYKMFPNLKPLIQ
jgi:hypothetical protein